MNKDDVFPAHATFAIALQSNDELIGFYEFDHICRSGYIEIFSALASEMRGRGYGTQLRAFFAQFAKNFSGNTSYRVQRIYTPQGKKEYMSQPLISKGIKGRVEVTNPASMQVNLKSHLTPTTSKNAIYIIISLNTVFNLFLQIIFLNTFYQSMRNFFNSPGF